MSLQIIGGLHEVRQREGEYGILMSWEGWTDLADRAREPLTHLREDIPGIVKDFLHTPKRRNLKSRILDLFY